MLYVFFLLYFEYLLLRSRNSLKFFGLYCQIIKYLNVILFIKRFDFFCRNFVLVLEIFEFKNFEFVTFLIQKF